MTTKGQSRTTAVNFTATTHPMSKLTLAGRFRNYDYSTQQYTRGLPVFPSRVFRHGAIFVRDLGSDDDDAAMVAAIIVMAHQLHIRVVAEGVETEAQLAFLRDRGCDEYQGYLFSRPLAAEQLDERMQGLRVDT